MKWLVRVMIDLEQWSVDVEGSELLIIQSWLLSWWNEVFVIRVCWIFFLVLLPCQIKPGFEILKRVWLLIHLISFINEVSCSFSSFPPLHSQSSLPSRRFFRARSSESGNGWSQAQVLLKPYSFSSKFTLGKSVLPYFAQFSSLLRFIVRNENYRFT